ncbi:hypothetical protein IV102_28070 [bacterium]|nr:hypothetical protein [bacterium]
MVLLSRSPLSRVEILPSDGPPVIIADTMVAGKSLHVVAAHPVPPIYGQASQRRNRMIQTLARHLATCPRPFVLLGDLNNTPWSPSLSPLPPSARNTRRGFGLLPSWPKLLPLPLRIPIDQCYVSEEVGVVQCQLGPDVGSDHFPLVVDVQL